MSKFKSVITALITPFKEDTSVDYESFMSLVNDQYNKGIRSFVVNGTTAESPNLEASEVEKCVSLIRDKYSNDVGIILGTGSNSTSKSIKMNEWASSLDVDAVLSVVPYYNKPTQEGLIAHFNAIADASKLPVILYNVPGRTVVSMKVETCVELSKHKNIIGIKEAAGDPQVIKSIKEQTEDFIVLSGDDGTYVEAATMGCDGVISVISHILPAEFISMTKKAHQGDETCMDDYKKYAKICDLLFAEPNPTPVKYCLKEMGIITTDQMRLPLLKCTSDLSSSLKAEIQNIGLLES